MTAALAAPRTGFKFTISVRQGPDKGASYQLLPPKVTLGRSPDNNVVFKDPKISRAAAVIEFTPDEITITDLSNRGTMFINGEQAGSASIKDGDSIQLGETEFAFVVEALLLSPQGPVAAAAPGGPRLQAFQPAAAPRAASGGNNRLVFYGVIALIAGGLYWFFSSGPALNKQGVVLRTSEAIEKDIQSSADRTDAIIKKRTFASDEERTRFEEAQKHYLEGFRDYQKGQWMRAMRSFETALAIDPDNQLARRYYKLSEKQRDEQISLLSLEGRRYKEKHMFARCSSAFEKVMEAITNKDDAKYKEAEALRKECELLEDERFQ